MPRAGRWAMAGALEGLDVGRGPSGQRRSQRPCWLHAREGLGAEHSPEPVPRPTGTQSSEQFLLCNRGPRRPRADLERAPGILRPSGSRKDRLIRTVIAQRVRPPDFEQYIQTGRAIEETRAKEHDRCQEASSCHASGHSWNWATTINPVDLPSGPALHGSTSARRSWSSASRRSTEIADEAKLSESSRKTNPEGSTNCSRH